VIEHLEVEVSRLAPGALDTVVALVAADGNGLVRQVGQPQQIGLNALVESIELGVEAFDAARHGAHLGDDLVGALTRLLELADSLARLVAPRLERVGLLDEAAATLVAGEEVIDIKIDVARRQPGARAIGVFAQLGEVVHGSEGASGGLVSLLGLSLLAVGLLTIRLLTVGARFGLGPFSFRGLLLVGIVGDVPAGAFETDGGRADQAVDAAPALRTPLARLVGKLLNELEPVSAATTFILIDGHCRTRNTSIWKRKVRRVPSAEYSPKRASAGRSLG